MIHCSRLACLASRDGKRNPESQSRVKLEAQAFSAGNFRTHDIIKCMMNEVLPMKWCDDEVLLSILATTALTLVSSLFFAPSLPLFPSRIEDWTATARRGGWSGCRSCFFSLPLCCCFRLRFFTAGEGSPCRSQLERQHEKSRREGRTRKEERGSRNRQQCSSSRSTEAVTD